jgi:hypothetical protein
MNRSGGAISVAVIVPTPELLKQMLLEKPPCWTWAAFASVLFQRWAVLEERKIEQVLGSPVQPTGELKTGLEVAKFIAQRMRDIDDIVREAGGYLKAPTFTAAFGASGDEHDADAVGIIQAANDLGDHYEHLLRLAEECRRYSVPDQYTELAHDCVRFANQPLQEFGRFVNDVLELLEDQQKRVMLGQDLIQADYLQIWTTTDDRLIWSILDRIQEIAKA